MVKELKTPLSKPELEKLIDSLVKTGNLYFAVRIEGRFSSVQTRTVSIQKKPYKTLDEVARDQQTFHFSEVKGTLKSSLGLVRHVYQSY